MNHPSDAARRADGRQYRSGHERRAEIVEATIAIIAERGLRELKTAELARRLGVSEATIFRHFDSMEEILVAAVEHETTMIRARIDAFEGSGTPWERAQQLVLAILDFFEETGGGPLVIVTGQVIRVSPEIREMVLGMLGHLRRRFLAITTEVESGAPGVAAERLADLLIAVIQSNGLRWLILDRAWPMHDSAQGMLDLLGRAVLPCPGDDA